MGLVSEALSMEARISDSTLFFRMSLTICLAEESEIGVGEGEEEGEGEEGEEGEKGGEEGEDEEAIVVLICSEVEDRCS